MKRALRVSGTAWIPLPCEGYPATLGYQRALKSIEKFTEFEQRAAYFNNVPVIATSNGVNILERGSRVHFMADFQSILDFQPAPSLYIFAELARAKASPAELNGEALFTARLDAPRYTRRPTTPITLCTTWGRTILQAPHDQRPNVFFRMT